MLVNERQRAIAIALTLARTDPRLEQARERYWAEHESFLCACVGAQRPEDPMCSCPMNSLIGVLLEYEPEMIERGERTWESWRAERDLGHDAEMAWFQREEYSAEDRAAWDYRNWFLWHPDVQPEAEPDPETKTERYLDYASQLETLEPTKARYQCPFDTWTGNEPFKHWKERHRA